MAHSLSSPRREARSKPMGKTFASLALHRLTHWPTNWQILWPDCPYARQAYPIPPCLNRRGGALAIVATAARGGHPPRARVEPALFVAGQGLAFAVVASETRPPPVRPLRLLQVCPDLLRRVTRALPHHALASGGAHKVVLIRFTLDSITQSEGNASPIVPRVAEELEASETDLAA